MAILAVEDGALFEGRLLGVEGRAFGELVFNTSSAGYEEIFTDPSYRGQILCMAFPMIGNYGFNPSRMESSNVNVSGLVVADADTSLDKYLQDRNVVGITGVDTRAIVRHLRDKGAMRAAVDSSGAEADEILEIVRNSPSMSGADLVSQLGAERRTVNPSGRVPIALLDCGVKGGIIRALAERDCRVEIWPAASSASDILAQNPAGIVLGNGPGDPAALPSIVNEVRAMIGKRPILGICLGHQLLALAAGAKTYKLPFGHRGANHPVIDLRTGAIAITSQNHGFAVDESTLPDSVIPTERNLYDGTNEAIEIPTANAFSVQYHPEAAPGPQDSHPRFTRFLEHLNATA